MTTSRPLRRLAAVFACASSLLALQTSTSAGQTGAVKWSDVPKGHWARAAVDHVGATYDWMRDFPQADDGTYPFAPDELESRELFARALVRAFAPAEPAAADLSFPDLPVENGFFPFANVAVKLGWMTAEADGNFLPDAPVTTGMVHRALVLAAGLGDLAAGADALHLRDGTKVPTPNGFGTLLIGMRMGLRYNHSDDSLDVGPDSPLPRAEVAWSLYRAATVPTWIHDWLAPYATMELPRLSVKMQRVVAFGVQYVGYPYVWSGEWYDATPTGYCCGAQPVGGFDCSGITWWVMKEATAGWDNTPPRDYRGWDLPQRSSADMASAGGKVKWQDLRPGDLMFYDGDGNGTVDHVNTYIGNGWAIDSSGGQGGVAIVRVDEGWYLEHFVHGRRIIGS